MRYNETYLLLEELEKKLIDLIDPVGLQKVIAAYEMAETLHSGQLRNDGTPYFFHIARTCKIILFELGLTDPDLLASSLLHDAIEDSKEISKNVLELNFGGYVAYIVEVLTKNLDESILDYDKVDLNHVETLSKASDDCVLIRLAARLDNFRCLEYNLKRNPLHYIQSTTERYIPVAESRSNPYLDRLVKALKNERNKFVG